MIFIITFILAISNMSSSSTANPTLPVPVANAVTSAASMLATAGTSIGTLNTSVLQLVNETCASLAIVAPGSSQIATTWAAVSAIIGATASIISELSAALASLGTTFTFGSELTLGCQIALQVLTNLKPYIAPAAYSEATTIINSVDTLGPLLGTVISAIQANPEVQAVELEVETAVTGCWSKYCCVCCGGAPKTPATSAKPKRKFHPTTIAAAKALMAAVAISVAHK